MAYIARQPAYGNFEKQVLTPDGSTTTFNLNFTIGNATSILVSVSNVIQEPETAYYLQNGGTQIVFTSAPSAVATVYIIYLGVARDVDNIANIGTITNKTELTSAAADDEILIYDKSTLSLKKIQKSNFDTSEIDINGKTDLSTGIEGADELAIYDNSAGEIKKVNLDNLIIGQTELSTTAEDNDVLLIYDTDAAEIKKIQKSNFVSDAKVLVSSNDTTPGFLNGKIVAGDNITLTEGNDGSNETLTVAANFTFPTISSISPDTITNAQTSITITGTNFVSIPIVEAISTTGVITQADSITYNNSTSLTCNFTLATDGTYYIRVENNNGLAVRSSTALLTVSDAPTWTTAAGSLGTFEGDFSGTLATVVATSDSAITYSEVGSNLAGANVTLNSSTGALETTDFGGSSTSATTYNFTIRATDAEGQTADRSFSLTSSFGATGGAQFN